MSSLRRSITGLALTAGLAFAPLALGAGPAAAALPCEWSETPGATNPWSYPIDDVACVVLDTSSGIRLVGVSNVQPGWTYVVKSAGGPAGSKSDRVEIRFENRKTGQKLTFRFEPGKTFIG